MSPLKRAMMVSDCEPRSASQCDLGEVGYKHQQPSQCVTLPPFPHMLQANYNWHCVSYGSTGGVIPYHYRSSNASISVVVVDGLPPTLTPAFSSIVVNPVQPRVQLSVAVNTHGDDSVGAMTFVGQFVGPACCSPPSCAPNEVSQPDGWLG
jgi:hypothetical protein